MKYLPFAIGLTAWVSLGCTLVAWDNNVNFQPLQLATMVLIMLYTTMSHIRLDDNDEHIGQQWDNIEVLEDYAERQNESYDSDDDEEGEEGTDEEEEEEIPLKTSIDKVLSEQGTGIEGIYKLLHGVSSVAEKAIKDANIDNPEMMNLAKQIFSTVNAGVESIKKEADEKLSQKLKQDLN